MRDLRLKINNQAELNTILQDLEAHPEKVKHGVFGGRSFLISLKGDEQKVSLDALIQKTIELQRQDVLTTGDQYITRFRKLDDSSSQPSGLLNSIWWVMHEIRSRIFGNRTGREKLYEKLIETMNERGICYQGGRGVDRDDAKAVQLYTRAAEAGNREAMCNLAYCYLEGIGVLEKDEGAAFLLYERAEQAGSIRARTNLGICYQHGLGIAIDKNKAFNLYKKAAQAGDGDAINLLGICYGDGIGVKENKTEAFKCYKKAVNKGNNLALSNIGFCYLEGLGVKQNPKRAFKWYEKAAQTDNYGIKQEEKEAGVARYYERAASAGYQFTPLVIAWLVKYYTENHNEERLVYWQDRISYSSSSSKESS